MKTRCMVCDGEFESIGYGFVCSRRECNTEHQRKLDIDPEYCALLLEKNKNWLGLNMGTRFVVRRPEAFRKIVGI